MRTLIVISILKQWTLADRMTFITWGLDLSNLKFLVNLPQSLPLHSLFHLWVTFGHIRILCILQRYYKDMIFKSTHRAIRSKYATCVTIHVEHLGICICCCTYILPANTKRLNLAVVTWRMLHTWMVPSTVYLSMMFSCSMLYMASLLRVEYGGTFLDQMRVLSMGVPAGEGC